MVWVVILWLSMGWGAAGQGPPDPAREPLEKAYAALKARDYEAAIAGFVKALEISPGRAVVRKDLAYTYLKTGENEAARDQFAEAMRLDPKDYHAALEFAFLANDTGEIGQARAVFDRLRKVEDKTTRETAEQAFRNIDQPLEEGIARWSKVVQEDPANFSACHELARLAERRAELALAAANYQRAWFLKPQMRSLLLDLGRVLVAMGNKERGYAALLAASRGAEPRAAEAARLLLPSRYPYVYEFRLALDLDRENIPLRRELGYLLLEMGKPEEAEHEFYMITKLAPEDLLAMAQLGFLRLSRRDVEGAMPLLEKVLRGPDEELADRVRQMLGRPRNLRRRSEIPRQTVAVEAKVMAERSFQAGFLKDALKYLAIAHETDPADFAVMLRLGQTHNILKDDKSALGWFNLARRSPDPAIASEASLAYRNLKPGLARFRTSGWFFPMYSSRWRDTFAYGQIRTEMRLGSLPLRAYLSTRFVGDIRRKTRDPTPQYLSENAAILGAGLATSSFHGLTLWGEAGTSVAFLKASPNYGHLLPDYRGGASYGRGWGRLLGGEARGAFFENNSDAVFVSRFDNDVLVYLQNRAGYTLPVMEFLGGLESQLYWNVNLTTDVRRQYWANFGETGPGMRFRWNWMPKSLSFSFSALRGVYLVRKDNPYAPYFLELRGGFWYAFAH